MNTEKIRLSAIIGVILALVFASPLVADAVVRTHFFPIDDARAEIDAFFAEDYVPIAFQINPAGAVSMGYIPRTDDLSPSGWLLYELEDIDDLEPILTAFITEGFVPVDLTVYGETMYFLLLELDWHIAEWKITADTFSRQGLVDTIARHRPVGFELYGLAFDGARVWYLFLDRGNPRGPEVEIAFMDNSTESVEQDAARRAPTGARLRSFTTLTDDLILAVFAR
ncbi:MAG: hypothetical protein EA426_06640 [Spirochaetaceae bacterium]|nr:MAG: hypothetical protein EA426_06640 [Spirochaetaceae bacterium]